MMTFSEFLIEEQSNYPWQFKTKEEVIKWGNFHLQQIINNKIKDNLEIDFLVSLKIQDDDLIQWSDGGHYIPVQFTSTSEYKFTTFKPNASLIGSPRTAGRVEISTGTVHSFEGIPSEIEILNMSKWNNLMSLKDIHKHIKQCEQMIIPVNVRSNILGLLYIDGLEVASPPIGANKILNSAMIIINKYLRNDPKNDVLDCQEELISAGLKEFAKL